MEEKSCTVLVNSCDRYSEAWSPFFKLFRKYWPECEYPVFLNTEVKECGLTGVQTICSGKEPWSDRLKIALENIDSEYVLFLLEDFFVQRKVNDGFIKKCLGMMQEDKTISCIYMKPITGHTTICKYYPEFYQIDYGRKYGVCFQAAIWRVKDLKAALPSGRNAWEIEEQMVFDKSVLGTSLCVKQGSYYNCSNDVIPYLWALDAGYGICKSKWLWNNHKLFRREGIDFKFKELDTMKKSTYLAQKYKKKIANFVGRK